MKRQLSILLNLFLLLALSACGTNRPSPSPMPSPTNVPTVTPVFAGAADLDRSFQTMREDLHLAAISAGIVKGDRLVWSGAYGLADVEAKRPATPETLFPMGSVSKTITGAALLHLWESGRFNLDDDINPYLPFAVRNPRFPDRPVTFRMLLTHTSGLNDYPVDGIPRKTLNALYGKQDSTLPLEEVLKGFLVPGGIYFNDANWCDWAPGDQYAYSNVAFALIGLLVERLSGESFTDYCREHLFAPLEMTRSTWRLADVAPEEFAFQYVPDASGDGKLIKIQPFTYPFYMDGSLRTSVVEYSHFLVMLLHGGRFMDRQVLQPETVAAMLTPQKVAIPPMDHGVVPFVDQTLVWPVYRLGDHILYSHAGGPGGFFTFVFFHPDSKIAGMIFVTGEFPEESYGRLAEVAIQMVELAGD